MLMGRATHLEGSTSRHIRYWKILSIDKRFEMEISGSVRNIRMSPAYTVGLA